MDRLGTVAVNLGVVGNACREPIFVVWLVLSLLVALFLLLLAFAFAFIEFGLNTLSDLVVSSRVPADHVDDAMHSPTFYVPKHQYSENWHLLLLLVLGSSFGAVHCAGWNLPFPTHAYQLLWRVTSIIITAVPITVPAAIFITLILRNLKKTMLKKSTTFELPNLYEVAAIPQLLVALLGLTYISARLILLALAVVLLRDQPQSALIDVDWIKSYPHI